MSSFAGRALVLAAIVGLGAFFRFHGLHWNDHGWPHPDERAVVSQTYDMLVADSYRPTIHTWGHFAYYSALFSYKAYLHLQYRLNTGAWWLSSSSGEAGARLAPVDGVLPHVRELSDLQLTTAALLTLAAICAGVFLLRRVPGRARVALGVAAIVLVALAWPVVRAAMRVPVSPYFDDVAIIGRALGAFASTASILLVYGIGARLYSPAAGVLAAAFFAVTLRAVQLAHFFAVEPLQTFGVLLAFWFAARLWSLHAVERAPRPEIRTVVLFAAIGAAIGLAMASKFSAAPLFALPLVVYLVLLQVAPVARPLVVHFAFVLCYVAALATWFHLHPYAWENPFEPFEIARLRPVLSDRWLHILFSHDFADQIAEQSRMVMGEGGPWVQQFVDTVPILTMTLEMIRWSFGWPLGVIVIGGFAYACARNLRHPHAPDLLLLSFVVPTFVILGGFKASFPRYTLPLLGLLCVFGARLCLQVGAMFGRRTAGVALGAMATLAGLIYCTAYMRIYDTPHAWTTASRWIYETVPPQRSDGRRTTIAHEEWDDDIPVAVGDWDPGRYAAVRMDPYGGDGAGKAERLAANLADADWIALATPRVYSTILKVTDRYPVTSAYYRLLFAGELGFTLRKTVYQPPQIWRFSFVDLSADESHYVYDHPKSVIFEKTTPLPRDELARRILDEANAPHALTRTQIMEAREGTDYRLLESAPRATDSTQRAVPIKIVEFADRRWEAWQAIKWLLVLQLLGVAVLPLTLWLFESLPDRGYPLARLIGWVAATYMASAAAALNVGRFTPGAAFISVFVLALASWLVGHRGVRRRLPPIAVVVTSELLFVVVFVAFAIIRAYNPEIYWGEKTMDFSLFNAVLRGGTIPPYEPWFAGAPLNYYYYGYFLIGLLTHLTATPTALAFNLALAAIPALTMTAAFSIVHGFTRAIPWGLVGAAAVGIIGNVDHLFQLAAGESHRSLWDSFWATSRALGPGMINEYPVWSWLFADLHAHVIVMPISMLCMALIAALYHRRRQPQPLGGGRLGAMWVALALTLGAQAATNLWDFIAYAGLLVIVLLATAVRLPFNVAAPAEAVAATAPYRPRLAYEVIGFMVLVLMWPAVGALHPYWLGLLATPVAGAVLALAVIAASRHDGLVRRGSHWLVQLAWSAVRSAILPASAVLVVSVLLFSAFFATLDTGTSALRVNQDGNIAVEHVVRHFGVFLILTIVWIVAAFSAHVARRRAEARRFWTPLVRVVLVEAVLLATLFYLGWLRSAGGLSLYLLLLPPVLAAATLEERTEFRFCGILLLCGWGLAAISELVVLTDRMNTVFKFYHPVWMFLAIGATGGLASVAASVPRLMRHAVLALASLLLLVTLWGTARAVYGVVTRNLKSSDKPTLNGMDFLRHTPEERELLDTVMWLDANATGLAVVAEAFTDRAYDDSARIAKYTGLPIVLGWAHHLGQRGRPHSQIEERQRDLHRLYTTSDEEELLRLCRKYAIRYIVVAELERERYGAVESRFSRMPHVREVFQSASRRYVVFAPAERGTTDPDSR